MRSKGSKPHTGLPCPEHQCQKEKNTQQLAGKIIRDSVHVCAVDTDMLVKRLNTDLLAHKHSL